MQVEFDRPIAGFINICPDDLSTHETQLELAIATIKHEILHALVRIGIFILWDQPSYFSQADDCNAEKSISQLLREKCTIFSRFVFFAMIP